MKFFKKLLPAMALFGAMTVHAQAPAGEKELSASAMDTQIESFKTHMRDDAMVMRHHQELARKAKDVIKLSCVNDKLVELKAQQNIYDLAATQYEDGRDGGTARSAFDAMSEVAAAVRRLRGESEACIGTPDLYKQESDVTVEHPPFPDDPTTSDPFISNIEPPAYASPFN